MINRLTISGLGLAAGLLIIGCNDSKQKESDQQPVQVAADESADAQPEDETTGDDIVVEKPVVEDTRPLIERFPPDIFPNVNIAPAQGRSLILGNNGGANNYELILLYSLQVYPVDELTGAPVSFSTNEEAVEFMTEWSAQFKANADFVATFESFIAGSSFATDVTYLSQAAYQVPANILEGAPDFVKDTLRMTAVRITTAAATPVAETTSIDITTEGLFSFGLPVTVIDYSDADLVTAQTEWDNSCAGCHNNPANEDTYIAHSSDYLSTISDTALSTLISTGVRPDQSTLSSPHTFALEAAPMRNLIALLRSRTPVLDKLYPNGEAPAVQSFRSVRGFSAFGK